MKSDKFESWIAELGNIRLFVTILVSAVFGGFMSLYITTRYEVDKTILTNPDLSQLFSILFVAFGYFVIIAGAVIILWMLIKALTLYINILWEPFGLFIAWYKRLLHIKDISEDDFKLLDGRIYKKYKRESNFVIIILSTLLIITEFKIFTDSMPIKAVIIIFTALIIIGLFNLIMWIKEKRKR